MKKLSIIVCLLFVTPSWGEVATAKKPALKPVPLADGMVALSPANSRIDFVGTHEGAKPDPRKGGFAKFAGQARLDSSGKLAAVKFEFQTASLWTEMPRLTSHLKSPDFFDVREHPKASFESTLVKPGKQDGTYEVRGKFTLLGKTKEVKIPATVAVTDAGVTLMSKFEIDRTQFGMTYGEGKVKKEVAIQVAIGTPTKTTRKR